MGLHRIIRCCLLVSFAAPITAQDSGPARDLGMSPGVMPPGPFNAITDVTGVLVGHATVVEGTRVNTGVTVILPHGGDLYRQRVRAAIAVGNGFGKLTGVTQVRELGELEAPVALTCTLCVHRVADALVSYVLEQPENSDIRSLNVVVGETNDGFLNDIRSRPVTEAHVREALESASTGPVEQGSVGAGRGTVAFGWKGGIGTSSRRLPDEVGGWTVGVLVQSNYGGVLSMDGVPVGEEMGRYYMRGLLERNDPESDPSPDGSIMMVVATDAPLDSRNLERLANRALAGLARTGSTVSNGTGDYVISFSTNLSTEVLDNNRMSPLFMATIEATEEAIYNSIIAATTVEGHRGTVEELPLDTLRELLVRYGRIE